ERDAHHSWARRLSENITEPLLTCEAVLSETAFHLSSASFTINLIEHAVVRLAFQMAEHLPRLKQLAERYADRCPDIADLCLIRMSELYPKYPVITTDVRDFPIYRRGRRERIPLLHP